MNQSWSARIAYNEQGFAKKGIYCTSLGITTKVDLKTKADLHPSAPFFAKQVLAAGFTMSDLKEITMCLAASIWHKPATFDELYKRKIDVLANASEYMFNSVLMSAKSRGWIYEKDGIWYCYKKTVKNVLNPAGFEIELIKDTRSEFRKQFDRLHGL